MSEAQSEALIVSLISRPIRALNAKTIKAAARAIGPDPQRLPHQIDEHVLKEVSAQLAAFPRWHRVGFRLGLLFLELGAPLGGWGITPFTLLSRAKAGARLESLMHSSFTPVRLFSHSLKMLACLSIYGHPEVESSFGFPRRRWRESRVALHDGLVVISEAPEAPVPPAPERLARGEVIRERDYLEMNAHECLQRGATDD